MYFFPPFKRALITGSHLFIVSILILNTVYAQTATAPKKLAIYYGMPSQVNVANGNLALVTDAFNDYDAIVLGGALEFPQYTGATGQIPYFGCDQNSHFDHDATQQLIGLLRPNTAVFGYVSIGGENTARRCIAGGVPVPYTVDEIKTHIDAWAQMGVVGIFLDEAEYGFGSSRPIQNEIIDYVHSKALKVFINGYEPDDIFGTKLVNEIVYSSGYYANTLSSIAMNPGGLASRLSPGDIYLMESYQIINGAFDNSQSWAIKSDLVQAYKKQYGIEVATVTTLADTNPIANNCSLLFDESKFDYAWWSTLLYGFDYMGWGEPSGFSSTGSCANSLPFHVRPNLGNIGEFTSEVVHPSANAQPTHYRETNTGTVEVNTGTHTGRYYAGLSLNQPPVANNDMLTTEQDKPIFFASSDLLENDFDTDHSGIKIIAIDKTSAKGGIITGYSNNTFVYSPPSNLMGTDGFNYSITDSMGLKAIGVVNVQITDAIPSITYLPKAVHIFRGQYDWGTLRSFKQSDWDTYDIKSSRAWYPKVAPPKITDWFASTKLDDISTGLSILSFSYKGQYSIENVMQSVYLFNYKLSLWELMDKRLVGNTDDVSVTAVINHPNDYVSANGEVKIRVRGSHPSQSFYSWANVLTWTVH